MKKRRLRERRSSPIYDTRKNLRVLKKYVRELRALLVEANTILTKLVLNPSAEIVRSLCLRFRILQEYFVLRYHDARAFAIAALGHVKAVLAFP